MADDFDDFINNLDDGTLHNSALSLSKLLALDDEAEDGGFEKLLGRLNDKDLEEIIDLDTLEQLEQDLMADEGASSDESPPQPPSPPAKAKRTESPEPAMKHPPTGKGKRVKDDDTTMKKEAVKVYCICRQPQNNRFMICCDRCEEWYHGDCVGISLERGRQMEKDSEDYTCDKCSKERGGAPPPVLQPAPSSVHIPSSLREKAKSLKVATVVPTKHYSSDTKYNRFDSYDTVDRSTSLCKIEGCHEYAMRNSPFCSEKCVLKFAQDNMKGSTTSKTVKSERSDLRESGRYEEKKLSQPNPLRLGVRKHLKTFLSTRAKEATDLLVTEDEIVKIAQNIEMSLNKLFPDCGNRYKAKCKAICFNISDSKNVNLYRNILSGTLSSEKLAKMSAEEMSVRVKAKQVGSTSTADVATIDNTVNIMDMLGDTTAQHGTHVFDVKCRKCTSKAPKREKPAAAAAAPTDTDLSTVEPVVNRLAISAKPLKDPLGLNPALWKGYITMTSLTKFATSGYHVYGPHESLLSSLPDTLHVQGRIANNIVWAYVDRLRKSPVKELIILKFESQNGEEVQGYSNLFHYLHTRTRCGVIGNVTAPVRDMYLVPLSAEGAMPPQLRLLGVSSIPKKNRTNLILGLIVVNKVGAKRPRDLIVEDIPPDEDPGNDPSTSQQDPPSSLDHLSTFPTDVSMPMNLAGGGGGGDADEASDDDGLNDIDMILRNNLPIGEVNTTTYGAGHCRDTSSPDNAATDEDEAAPLVPGADGAMRVVPTYHPDPTTNFPAPDTPYGFVDGKPILSPLTPLAPPALSFHPEDGPSVPLVFGTDYSPISPTAKHVFLNPPSRSFTSPPNVQFNDTTNNYSNQTNNFSNPSNNFSNTCGNPKMLFQSNQPVMQTPKSVYPSHQGSPGFVNSPDKTVGAVGPVGAVKGFLPQSAINCGQNNQLTDIADPNFNDLNTTEEEFAMETNSFTIPLGQSGVQTDVKMMSHMIAPQATLHRNMVPSPQKMVPRQTLLEQNMMPRQMWAQKVINPQHQLQQMATLTSPMPVHQTTQMIRPTQQQNPMKVMMSSSPELSAGLPGSLPTEQPLPPHQIITSSVSYPAAPKDRILLPRQTAPPKADNAAAAAFQHPSQQQFLRMQDMGNVQRFRGGIVNAQQLRGANIAAQIPPNLMGARTTQGMMSSQQQAVLRQAALATPVRARTIPSGTIAAEAMASGPMSPVPMSLRPMAGPQGAQHGVYFSHPPQTFIMPDSRQPVALSPNMSHRPVVYQLGANTTHVYPANIMDSPTKSTAKAASNKRSSNIKAKLKSKIDRNKGTSSPKVKNTPKLFDGDSLLAQLEEVT